MKSRTFAVLSAKDWLSIKIAMFVPIVFLVIVPVGVMHHKGMHITFGFVVPALMLAIAAAVFPKSATTTTKVILILCGIVYTAILGMNVYHSLM